jgi:hypothetical protein
VLDAAGVDKTALLHRGSVLPGINVVHGAGQSCIRH